MINNDPKIRRKNKIHLTPFKHPPNVLVFRFVTRTRLAYPWNSLRGVVAMDRAGENPLPQSADIHRKPVFRPRLTKGMAVLY